MGLTLRFRLNPSPRGLNHTDHGLPAGMNVDVLDRDLLLALAAVTIECIEQHGVRTRKLFLMSESIQEGIGFRVNAGLAGSVARRLALRYWRF
jgi:hypothetical protein